jgi:hypothetical protein
MDISVISPQAFVVIIAYCFICVSLIIPGNEDVRRKMNKSYDNKTKNSENWLIHGLSLIFPVIITIYSIHCMSVGGCFLWSWVNAGIILAWAMSIFLLSIFSN